MYFEPLRGVSYLLCATIDYRCEDAWFWLQYSSNHD